MSMFDQARDAAQKFAQDNPDKVREAVQRVGEEVDQRTGNKFTDQIDQAEQTIADRLAGDAPQPQESEQDQA
ncbi:antitoxin [Raineyella sp. W15-4]|uniref:antitoxin n=1 Tax=Raineyella sp. W15-4 TaxID=3081651 RepID=UPI002954855D|nr:antitoxin [Raineyella sp. W15-4]WOQ18475.1 antitoxin [Raineyella sp. W15-4]